MFSCCTQGAATMSSARATSPGKNAASSATRRGYNVQAFFAAKLALWCWRNKHVITDWFILFDVKDCVPIDDVVVCVCIGGCWQVDAFQLKFHDQFKQDNVVRSSRYSIDAFLDSSSSDFAAKDVSSSMAKLKERVQYHIRSRWSLVPPPTTMPEVQLRVWYFDCHMPELYFAKSSSGETIGEAYSRCTDLTVADSELATKSRTLQFGHFGTICRSPPSTPTDSGLLPALATSAEDCKVNLHFWLPNSTKPRFNEALTKLTEPQVELALGKAEEVLDALGIIWLHPQRFADLEKNPLDIGADMMKWVTTFDALPATSSYDHIAFMALVLNWRDVYNKSHRDGKSCEERFVDKAVFEEWLNTLKSSCLLPKIKEHLDSPWIILNDDDAPTNKIGITHLERNHLLTAMEAQLQIHRVLVLSGTSTCGKSALVAKLWHRKSQVAAGSTALPCLAVTSNAFNTSPVADVIENLCDVGYFSTIIFDDVDLLSTEKQRRIVEWVRQWSKEGKAVVIVANKADDIITLLEENSCDYGKIEPTEWDLTPKERNRLRTDNPQLAQGLAKCGLPKDQLFYWKCMSLVGGDLDDETDVKVDGGWRIATFVRHLSEKMAKRIKEVPAVIGDVEAVLLGSACGRTFYEFGIHDGHEDEIWEGLIRDDPLYVDISTDNVRKCVLEECVRQGLAVKGSVCTGFEYHLANRSFIRMIILVHVHRVWQHTSESPLLGFCSSDVIMRRRLKKFLADDMFVADAWENGVAQHEAVHMKHCLQLWLHAYFWAIPKTDTPNLTFDDFSGNAILRQGSTNVPHGFLDEVVCHSSKFLRELLSVEAMLTAENSTELYKLIQSPKAFYMLWTGRELFIRHAMDKVDRGIAAHEKFRTDTFEDVHLKQQVTQLLDSHKYWRKMCIDEWYSEWHSPGSSVLPQMYQLAQATAKLSYMPLMDNRMPVLNFAVLSHSYKLLLSHLSIVREVACHTVLSTGGAISGVNGSTARKFRWRRQGTVFGCLLKDDLERLRSEGVTMELMDVDAHSYSDISALHWCGLVLDPLALFCVLAYVDRLPSNLQSLSAKAFTDTDDAEKSTPLGLATIVYDRTIERLGEGSLLADKAEALLVQWKEVWGFWKEHHIKDFDRKRLVESLERLMPDHTLTNFDTYMDTLKKCREEASKQLGLADPVDVKNFASAPAAKRPRIDDDDTNCSPAAKRPRTDDDDTNCSSP